MRTCPHMIMLKPCIYKGKVSDEELFKDIETEYFNGAFGVLTGPKKEFAFGLLKDYPPVFVRLIAMYLLGYTAPRIKRKEVLSRRVGPCYYSFATTKFRSFVLARPIQRD